MLRNVKFLFVILAVLVIAGSAFAFAAANTVPTTLVLGDGLGDVSGYTITDVVYTSGTLLSLHLYKRHIRRGCRRSNCASSTRSPPRRYLVSLPH